MSAARRAGIALIIVAGMLANLLAASLPVYVFPPQLPPQPSDVVMVVGPAEPWRIAWAQQLIATSHAKELLISTPPASRPAVCGSPGVLCFEPIPFTTQGEARELAEQMKLHHWTTATVITGTPHILRTRLRMWWCMSTGVQVVGRPTGLSAGDWVWQYIYQSAGFLKAFLVTPGC